MPGADILVVNKDTRFKPGHAPLPGGGRPKKVESLTAHLWDVAFEVDPKTGKTHVRLMAENLWSMATGTRGKLAIDSSELILNRLLGRPAQELRLMGELDEESKMLMAALAAKLQPQLGPVIEGELVEPDASERANG